MTRLIFLFFSAAAILYTGKVHSFQVPDTMAADTLETERQRTFLALPLVTYSPETRLQFGAAGLFYFRIGDDKENTQLSTIRTPISYTLNNQFKARVSYDLFLNRNQHVFKGITEWFYFPLAFWGIGATTPDQNEELYTTKTFVFNISYLTRITNKLFVGGGYDLRISDISEIKKDGLLAEEGLIPGNNGGVNSGIFAIFRHDTRDNNLNAAKGMYIQGKVSYYLDWWGSDFRFAQIELDLRKYLTVFNKHVVALQFLHRNNEGDPGFETMALLGGEMIMRGHYEGRYRDNGMNAFQAEYRLPLGRETWIDTRRKMPFLQRFGLVAFAGAGQVYSSLGQMGFRNMKGSFGVGMRFLAIPEESINIRMDLGFGTEKPGIYFQIREAF